MFPVSFKPCGAGLRRASSAAPVGDQAGLAGRQSRDTTRRIAAGSQRDHKSSTAPCQTCRTSVVPCRAFVVLMPPCRQCRRYRWWVGADDGDHIYMSRKFESFKRINSIRETNGNFDSCNSCKRLVPSRLHEPHGSKFPFVSRIEFIRSKLSNFSAHVYGVSVCSGPPGLQVPSALPTSSLLPGLIEDSAGAMPAVTDPG